MVNNKILGLIGLAARARKLCFGADSVEEKTKKGKVKLLIIAEDASNRRLHCLIYKSRLLSIRHWRIPSKRYRISGVWLFRSPIKSVRLVPV